MSDYLVRLVSPHLIFPSLCLADTTEGPTIAYHETIPGEDWAVLFVALATGLPGVICLPVLLEAASQPKYVSETLPISLFRASSLFSHKLEAVLQYHSSVFTQMSLLYSCDGPLPLVVWIFPFELWNLRSDLSRFPVFCHIRLHFFSLWNFELCGLRILDLGLWFMSKVDSGTFTHGFNRNGRGIESGPNDSEAIVC